MALIRTGRLSVIPLTPTEWQTTRLSDFLKFDIHSAPDQPKVGDISGQDKRAVAMSGQGDQAIVLQFAALVHVEPLVVPDGAHQPACSQPVLRKWCPDFGGRPRQGVERPTGGAIPGAPVKLTEDHGALPQHKAARELVQTMR